MITFFTTLKHLGIAESNAINSWLATSPEVEVIIFTESNNRHSWNFPKRVLTSTNFDRHESGPPLLNTIFDEASTIAKNPFLCYCNSDIILSGDFFERVAPILKIPSSFLAVSQRLDFNLNEQLDFENPEWKFKLKGLLNSGASLHPPFGSDIFLFPRYQYTIGNMPALVVGRPCWDNWMFYNARERFNKLIDFTGSIPVVYHQNHLQNYDPSKDRQINAQFLPPGHEYTFLLDYANFKVDNGKLTQVLKKTPDIVRVNWELQFSRGSWAYYYYYVVLLIYKIKFKLSL